MTKKAAPPEKKKRKSIKRPEHGPPKMRLSLRKLRQITANATKRLAQEDLARRSRQEQNAAKEAERQKGRDIEAARKLLVGVGKAAREAANVGLITAEVYCLKRDDYELIAGVDWPSYESLRGPALHLYDALVKEGFVVGFVHDSSGHFHIRIRWE